MRVLVRTIGVAQNPPDVLQGNERVFASVGVACRGRHSQSVTGHSVAAAVLLLVVCVFVFTIGLYDDDILGLVEIVSIPVRLEEADHFIDALQGGVEVRARPLAVACRGQR